MKASFTAAVSLGSTCATKYQVARHFYQRLFAGTDLAEFHRIITSPQDAHIHFGTHIFDWQITPFSAVCEYLEADFEGTFERCDLEPITDGNHVRNRRFGTLHPHAFTVHGGAVTDQQLDLEYPIARQKMDYLAEKFRRLIRSPGPVLYLFYRWGALPAGEQIARLVELLGSKSADHRFHLALLNIGSTDPGLSDFGRRVSTHLLPEADTKPADRRWQGDDAAWEEVLGSFGIGLPEDLLPAAGRPLAEAAPLG